MNPLQQLLQNPPHDFDELIKAMAAVIIPKELEMLNKAFRCRKASGKPDAIYSHKD